MFTTGRIIFTIIFLIGFILLMTWSYIKDKKINSVYFPNSYKILAYIVLVLGLLFLFVKTRHYL